jgi:hypothetical protein
VKIVFNQGNAVADYMAEVPAGTFIQKVGKLSWKFVDKEADIANALGWHGSKISQAVNSNKIKDAADGRGVSIPLNTTLPIRVRQTIRIGDDCATALLLCDLKPNGKVLKCKSTTLGSPSGAFLEGANTP